MSKRSACRRSAEGGPQTDPTSHGSRIIKNEPNSQFYQVSKAPTKHENGAYFTTNFINTYLPKAKKSKKIPAFCKFLTLTHLTPYTTKTYITFLPQYTLIERNLPAVFLAQKNAKRTQFYPQLFFLLCANFLPV